MPVHDTLDDRQPQPGPLALGLGSEKRLEDALDVLRTNARAGVAHLHLCGARLGNPHRQVNLAVVRSLHRLGGIDHQVAEHLLNLRRVSVYGRQLHGEVPVYLAVFGYPQILQTVEYLLHLLPQVDLGHPALLRLSQVGYLLGQIHHLLGGGQNVFHVLAGFGDLAFVHLHQGQLHLTHDHLEGRLILVGDARRQLTQKRQALGVEQLLLHLLALGQVFHHVQPGNAPVSVVEHVAAVHQRWKGLSVLAHLRGLAHLRPVVRLPSFGETQPGQRAPGDLLLAEPVHLFGPAVEGQDMALLVRRHDAERSRVDQMAQKALPLGHLLAQLGARLQQISQQQAGIDQPLALAQYPDYPLPELLGGERPHQQPPAPLFQQPHRCLLIRPRRHRQRHRGRIQGAQLLDQLDAVHVRQLDHSDHDIEQTFGVALEPFGRRTGGLHPVSPAPQKLFQLAPALGLRVDEQHAGDARLVLGLLPRPVVGRRLRGVALLELVQHLRLELAARFHLLDAIEELAQPDRLLQVVVGPLVKRGRSYIFVAVAGHQHHRNARETHAHRLEQPQAVQPGHADIADDQPHVAFLLQHLQSLGAVAGGAHPVPAVVEEVTDDLEDVALVVYQQNFHDITLASL